MKSDFPDHVELHLNAYPDQSLHFFFQEQDLMKLLNISRGPQKKRGKDRFGAAGNLTHRRRTGLRQ
jgi:hypothetical protein